MRTVLLAALLLTSFISHSEILSGYTPVNTEFKEHLTKEQIEQLFFLLKDENFINEIRAIKDGYSYLDSIPATKNGCFDEYLNYYDTKSSVDHRNYLFKCKELSDGYSKWVLWNE